MRQLLSFMQISLDGYFADAHGDMSWAHRSDPEWNEFVAGNASGGGALLFGRVTYDLMVRYWPTPMAIQNDPIVAAGMNTAPKYVASRTLQSARWQNTTVLKGELAAEVRRLKSEPGPGLALLGSGSLVAQLSREGLIDEYQIVVNPITLGAGKKLFEDVKLSLKLVETRAFGNGNVVLSYQR